MGKVFLQLKYHIKIFQEYNLIESQGVLQFSFRGFYLLCAALSEHLLCEVLHSVQTFQALAALPLQLVQTDRWCAIKSTWLPHQQGQWALDGLAGFREGEEKSSIDTKTN